MRIVIKITFKIYFGLHLLRRYSLTRVATYNVFIFFKHTEPQINDAHQWTLKRPCSQKIFPLEIHLWHGRQSCRRGKGLHQKHERRQPLRAARSGPQSCSGAPSLVLSLCVGSKCEEHREFCQHQPVWGKRLSWCRASKSKILRMTEILENTRKSNAKGRERTDTARNLPRCSVFLIMAKPDSETLIRERIRNSIRMKNSGLVNMETLKHARYDFIVWRSLLALSLGELRTHWSLISGASFRQLRL